MDAMEKRNSEGLTPGERDALDALPREGMPSRFLEERTVQALRERGLIRSGSTRVGRRRPWMVAAAVAASVALFASGLAVGQWVGSRQTADALATVYPDQADRAAALVQTTGSAYTAALGRLVEVTAAADTQEVQRAREVALAALWAAASEVVRLAPEDPLAVEILQGFERARSEGSPGDSAAARNFVWF
jgi:hypothetical protein